MRRFTCILAALMALASAPLADEARLPGDDLAAGERACFSFAAPADHKITRLLVELHKDVVNEGDEPVIWAGIYGEKRGETLPGFNRDGCSPFDPGGTEKLDHLLCGFACDGGTLRVKSHAMGIEIAAKDLVLRSCGLGGEIHGGFLIAEGELGAEAVLTLVDDGECRKVMAPMEETIRRAEEGID